MGALQKITRGTVVCVREGPHAGTIGIAMGNTGKFIMLHTERGIEVFGLHQIEVLDG